MEPNRTIPEMPTAIQMAEAELVVPFTDLISRIQIQPLVRSKNAISYLRNMYNQRAHAEPVFRERIMKMLDLLNEMAELNDEMFKSGKRK